MPSLHQEAFSTTFDNMIPQISYDPIFSAQPLFIPQSFFVLHTPAPPFSSDSAASCTIILQCAVPSPLHGRSRGLRWANVVCCIFLAFHVCSPRVSDHPSAVKPYSYQGVGFTSAWCTLIIRYRLVGDMLILHLGALGMLNLDTTQ